MITLSPTESTFKIIKPSKGYFTEFEVQATLYVGLKDIGIDARGEVNHRVYGLRGRVDESSRFDVVIFEDDEAVHILEVKAAPIKHKRGVEKTRQGCRYRRYGVPVTFIYGMEEAKAFVSSLSGAGGGFGLRLVKLIGRKENYVATPKH